MILLPGAVQRQIGQRLRALRVAESWTQEDLAARSGVGVATVRRAEKSGNITLPNLLRLAATLGALDSFTQILRVPEPISLDAVVRPVRRRVRRKLSEQNA